MSSSLSAAFKEARIPFQLASAPLRQVDRDIFQLDIRREPAERVLLWPGGSDNGYEPLSVDRLLCQVLLAVQEPRRPYEERIRIREGRVTREQIEAFVRESGGGRVLRPRGSSWIVEKFSDPAERRFLVGFDQRHLFAAQIPSGNTVRQAHDALKPEEVRIAEARWPGQTVRQGEWFFVPVTPKEEQEARWGGNTAGWPWRHRLPSTGEPHYAEFLTIIRPVNNPDLGWRGLRIYARGTVHHRDHRTVCFDRWRRVHLNTEVRRRKELARGFYWID
jgi:hypothetical protein